MVTADLWNGGESVKEAALGWVGVLGFVWMRITFVFPLNGDSQHSRGGVWASILSLLLQI